MRCLLNRRKQVDAVFPEGFEGLLETIHGDCATGLIEAAHALVDAAYFQDAIKALHEAARRSGASRVEIDSLARYSIGMQAFLDGDYRGCITELEAWVDLGAHGLEPELARRAGAALSRIGRLVENDAEGSCLVDSAKQLEVQLETASV